MNLTRADADEPCVLVELRCYCAAGKHALIVRRSLAPAYAGHIFTLCPATARSDAQRSQSQPEP